MPIYKRRDLSTITLRGVSGSMRNNCLFINVLISQYSQKTCNTTFVFACFSTMGKVRIFKMRSVLSKILNKTQDLEQANEIINQLKGYLE